MTARLSRSVPSTLFRSQPTSVIATPLHFSPYSRPQFQHPTSDLRTLRPFTSCTPSRASEAPRDPFEHRANWQSETPLYERLQNHPECMAAIEKLAEAVKSKTGVNLTSGEAPSMSMMYTLATDPTLRAAAQNLMDSLREAGIEVDPKAAFRALKMMGGQGFEGSQELGDLHEAMRKGEGEEEGEGEAQDGEGATGEGRGKGKK